MNYKKIMKLIILNLIIILSNIAVYSNTFLGLSFFEGTTLSISTAWSMALLSIIGFTKGNMMLLKEKNYLNIHKVHSLNDCISEFEIAIDNGDIFDEKILINIEQIKRFIRKRNTITDILLQKFSETEMSYKKFQDVLDDVEKSIYLNMKSILNKISAFDVEDYEKMAQGKHSIDEFTEEKKAIYTEYIEFVDNATNINESILLKLDKILLEISKYNTIEKSDIAKLPAIQEMDELIRNAKLYK